MTLDLTGRKVAVVGGDEREREIARIAATTGATVSAYGFPWPDKGIEGVTLADSAAAALNDADYALFPIPGLATDGALFAPSAPERIVPDASLLSGMRPGATILLGTADERLRSAAAATSVRLSEYEQDTELMLLRGPAIVEGALQLAIEHTDVTLHASPVGVVGHGNVGRLLARTLVLLGADVHVFARNPVQRADAHAAGCHAHPLSSLPERAETLAMLFSVVPAPVVSPEVLERMPRESLVMDLAAPPGGFDHDAAHALGHRVVWARGMGRRAPVTVGQSQWTGIARRLAEIEEGTHEG